MAFYALAHLHERLFFLSLNAIKMSFRVYMKKKILQQEKFALRYSEYLVAVLKLLAGKYFEDTQLDEMMKNILIDSLLKTAKINSKISFFTTQCFTSPPGIRTSSRCEVELQEFPCLVINNQQSKMLQFIIDRTNIAQSAAVRNYASNNN